jgi:heme O synthase-like polyprenyltransferase
MSTLVVSPLARQRAVRSTLGSYLALTKPRIVELLLVTALPTMVVARHGLPSGLLVLVTLFGGTVAASGANAVNMVVDRDIFRGRPSYFFAIIFIWTPPNFWSLAVRSKDDDAAADVPMLPVVATMKRTTFEIMLYSAVLVVISLLFGLVAHIGCPVVASRSHQSSDRQRGHAGLQLLHHLSHGAFRGHGRRRVDQQPYSLDPATPPRCYSTPSFGLGS